MPVIILGINYFQQGFIKSTKVY